jgi:ribose transport system permease protein
LRGPRPAVAAASPTAHEAGANGVPRRFALQRHLLGRPGVVLGGLLVLLIVATDVASPGFVTPHQLSTTLLYAAPLGALAAGQTLVMLTGGIDLSVSATATAAAYLMAGLGGRGPAVALFVAIALGLAIGLVNGIGVGIFRVQPLIMTLGMAGILGGTLTLASLQFTGGIPIVPESVHQLGSGTILGYVPINLLVWAPLALVLVIGQQRSGLGRLIYAVGDNPLACRLAGVRVWQVLLVTYILCALFSTLAGILLVGYTNAADLNLATPYLLQSVAAVVIGGTSILGGSGGYAGTILGALILTVLDSLLTILNISQAGKQMLYGGIVLGLAWVYARTAEGG